MARRLLGVISYNKLKDRATKVVFHGYNRCFIKYTAYQRNEYVAELVKRRAQGYGSYVNSMLLSMIKKGIYT